MGNWPALLAAPSLALTNLSVTYALTTPACASDAAPDCSPFLALVATMVGALSCLVVLAQWFPQWILSPCAS
jgi:hypothetical protein